MADAPLPHYWNLGYEHNNQTFAHKVFGKKHDRKTENIGDMETMLQTPDAMRPKGEYKDTPVQVKTEGAEILITRAKQENCHSNGISDSDLDDNEEDPLPLVIAVTDINVREGEPLHTETGVEVIENKQQKLFGVHPQKIRQHFFDNEVVDSLLERSDPLILDGTRLMHKHIFMHFPFDPGESIPPSIMFESLDIHLDKSYYLSTALYAGVFVLDCTMKGGKLFNEISISKVGVQTSQLRLPQQFVEIAKKFNDSKTYARVVAAIFSSKLQPTATALVAMLQKWKVLNLRSENKLVTRHRRRGLVARKRSGGERAYKIVHEYFKVNNFSSDGSDHVKEYCLHHISSASDASSNRSSSRDNILGIPLVDTDSYILAYFVSMSFGKEGIDAKKERKDHLSYIHELLLVNIIRVPQVDTSNASKLKTIIILFLTVFTCSNQANYNTSSCQMKFPDMNLEDKVLFGAGSIVVNLDDSIRAYGLDVVNKTDPVDIIGPSKMLESFIWIQAQLAIVKKV